MARRTFFGFVVACLVYAAVLVATIPAPWVSWAVERASDQGLLLRDPAGNAWAGSGILCARTQAGALLELGRVRWNTSVWGLVSGHLAAEITVNDNAKATNVDLSFSGVTVRGLNLDVPGRILAELAPALGAFGPEGILMLRSDSLRVESGSILGLAQVEWRQARLARANGLDLGSHVARLRGGGSKVDIEFASLDGPLRLGGGGTWTRDAGLDVSGSAEHAPEGTAALARFLQGVCSEYKPGRCGFRYKQHRAPAR